MRRSALLLVSLLIVTAIVFAPAIGHRFIAWDDQLEIYLNPDFHPVTWDSLAENWTHTRLTVWMPLTYYIWGGIALMSRQAPDAEGIDLNPALFHTVCVVSHLISTGFVYLILRSFSNKKPRDWGGKGHPADDPSARAAGQSAAVPVESLGFASREMPALIGATFFALHPIQVEAVAWASGMYTVLSAALCLAAIDQYLRSVDAEKSSRRWLHFVLATVLFILALLTKPTAIVLPLIVLAIDPLLIRTQRKCLWAMLATWVPLSITTFLIARHFHFADEVASYSVGNRLVVACDAIGFYLAKIVLPVHLIPDYGRSPASVIAGHSMFWILPLVLLTLLAVIARRTPRIVAGAIIFLLAIAPYSGLVKFDYQFYSTVTDRYAYFAMFGVAVIVASLLDRWRHPAVTGFAIACTITMGVLSAIQITRWQDTRSLFEYTLTVRPDSLVANKVLGAEYTRDDPTRAEGYFKAALSARDDDAVVHYNYAGLLIARGDLAGAIEQWQKTVDVRPQHYKALNNLGVAMLRQRDFDRAEAFFKQSIDASEASHDPFADAYQNLGLLQVGLGQTDEAVKNLQIALRLDPSLSKAKNALAAARKNSASVP